MSTHYDRFNKLTIKNCCHLHLILKFFDQSNKAKIYAKTNYKNPIL